jgi:hypothetical protein
LAIRVVPIHLGGEMARLWLLALVCGAMFVTAASAQTNLAAGKPVTASSFYAGDPPSYAVDADTTRTAWNSGNGGPSWIEIDLGADTVVGSFVGRDAVIPGGQINHTLTGRTSGGVTYSLGSWSGAAGNGTLIKIGAAAAPPVRYVRITSQSPVSWIAWWDLRIYAGVTTPTRASTWGQLKALWH